MPVLPQLLYTLIKPGWHKIMKGLLLCNIPKKTLGKVVNDFAFGLQKQQQCYIVIL